MGFKKIAEQIKSDIDEGRLPSGAPLPPTREMAARLNVSRDTMVNAYSALKNWGYIETDGRRGTFVSYQVQNSEGNVPQIADSRSDSLKYSAVPGEALPMRRWRELLGTYVQKLKTQDLVYKADPFGDKDFRQALSRYLAYSRGISCPAQDIAVFNISLSAVSLLLSMLTNAGDAIALESPGYEAVRKLAELRKLKIIDIPVDAEGAIIERLSLEQKTPKVIYLTPDSHDPTGARLSLKRRLEILAWAKKHDAWIIEDAFDANFQYGEAPPASLKALDTEGRVFYLATFWQLLYPLATTSYLLVPPAFSPSIKGAKALTDGVAEHIPQAY